MTSCEVPYVRADWFVHAAARPKLYHELVTLPDYQGVPERVSTLERLLGVDMPANFDNDRLWRAGFSSKKSGLYGSLYTKALLSFFQLFLKRADFFSKKSSVLSQKSSALSKKI